MDIDACLERARAMGLEVNDSTFRHVASGIGTYVNTEVGPVLRSVQIVFAGPIKYIADADYVSGLRWEPADETIRELGEALRRAAEHEGVEAWWGHSAVGVGCLWQYSPPASRKASALAEAIRVARVRALSRPGRGHEEQLEQLVASA